MCQCMCGAVAHPRSWWHTKRISMDTAMHTPLLYTFTQVTPNVLRCDLGVGAHCMVHAV